MFGTNVKRVVVYTQDKDTSIRHILPADMVVWAKVQVGQDGIKRRIVYHCKNGRLYASKVMANKDECDQYLKNSLQAYNIV